MQRTLVEHINLHADGKNTGSYLNRMWMGGFQAQRDWLSLESKLPADLTAEMLNSRLLCDLNNSLPSPVHALVQRQYRQISLQEEPQDSSRTNQNALLYGDETDPDLRIIFHPPRGGEDLQPETPSRCTNSLFEATRRARLRDGAQNTMVYTFPPTMTWYKNQMSEGRHFEHILVGEWEKVFKEFVGIDGKPSSKGAPTPTSATSAHPPQAGPLRNGSVSSNHSSSTY